MAECRDPNCDTCRQDRQEQSEEAMVDRVVSRLDAECDARYKALAEVAAQMAAALENGKGKSWSANCHCERCEPCNAALAKYREVQNG